MEYSLHAILNVSYGKFGVKKNLTCRNIFIGGFENARIPAGDIYNGTEGVIKTYAYLCFHVCCLFVLPRLP